MQEPYTVGQMLVLRVCRTNTGASVVSGKEVRTGLGSHPPYIDAIGATTFPITFGLSSPTLIALNRLSV
jgi:hypothetical protein